MRVRWLFYGSGRCVLLLAGLLSFAGACRTHEVQTTPARDPRRGQELFVAKACASCHGDRAGGQYGPPLGERRYSIEEFRRAIREPLNMMPAYDRDELSEEDLQHLHAYVLELSSDPPSSSNNDRAARPAM